MDKLEFENDRKIDPNALDIEAAQQADLFFKWAERSIQARGDVDRRKLLLEVVEARIQAKVRAHPEQYDIEKATETAINAAVKTDGDYIIAHETYLEARETAALLEKAVIAMEIKKRMIESLITLHGQQYFAGPSSPRNLSEMWQKQKEFSEQKLSERQARRTRRRGE